jgi:hypothetical protein
METVIWMSAAVVLLLLLVLLASWRRRGTDPTHGTTVSGTGGSTHDTWSTGGGGLS